MQPHAQPHPRTKNFLGYGPEASRELDHRLHQHSPTSGLPSALKTICPGSRSSRPGLWAEPSPAHRAPRPAPATADADAIPGTPLLAPQHALAPNPRTFPISGIPSGSRICWVCSAPAGTDHRLQMRLTLFSCISIAFTPSTNGGFTFLPIYALERTLCLYLPPEDAAADGDSLSARRGCTERPS